MHAEEYKRMFQLEDSYWWFVDRRRVALRLLRKFCGEKPRILDLGCGTGVILSELSTWSDPVGLDMSSLALSFCQERGQTKLVRARGEFLPLSNASVDGVLALDIFEHIERDDLAFKEAFRVLRPGGHLVLSVPAFMSLWGPHDVALMHFRRYRAREMRKSLEAAGFKIQRLSYSVFFLFPVVVMVRFFEKRRKGEAKASLPSVPSWANKALIRLQDVESAIIGSLSLPWGSSVIAVAKKP